GEHAGHPGAIERAPDLACPEHAFPEEPSILVRGMQPGQRRQRMVERGPMNPRRGVHISQFELPQHFWDRYFAAALCLTKAVTTSFCAAAMALLAVVMCAPAST